MQFSCEIGQPQNCKATDTRESLDQDHTFRHPASQSKIDGRLAQVARNCGTCQLLLSRKHPHSGVCSNQLQNSTGTHFIGYS